MIANTSFEIWPEFEDFHNINRPKPGTYIYSNFNKWNVFGFQATVLNEDGCNTNIISKHFVEIYPHI